MVRISSLEVGLLIADCQKLQEPFFLSVDSGSRIWSGTPKKVDAPSSDINPFVDESEATMPIPLKLSMYEDSHFSSRLSLSLSSCFFQ